MSTTTPVHGDGDLRHFGMYLARNRDIVEMFRKKASFMGAAREYLNRLGAIELPMPNLQKYREGAPVHQFVTTHPFTKERFYLRHCMEDHLRRASGVFGKVYELGKAFRVENEDRQRAIEFLVLEFVGPDIPYREGVRTVRGLIQHGVQSAFGELQVNGIDFGALADRPFDSVMKGCLGFDSSDLDFRGKAAAALARKGVPAPPEDWEVYEELLKHYIEPSIQEPTVITDFPACLKHVCAIDEATGTAKRFSLIVNGVEICDGGEKFGCSDGYRKVYEANADYRRRQLGITDNDEPVEFYDDIDALAGPVFTFGLGIDRCLAVFTGKSIQEVILFPHR